MLFKTANHNGQVTVTQKKKKKQIFEIQRDPVSNFCTTQNIHTIRLENICITEIIPVTI